MTCIVALRHANRIYMGADSIGSNGYSVIHRKDKKLFRKKDMIIGYTSSYRMGQIIQYHLKLPTHKKVGKDGELIDTHEYMVMYFIPELQKTLEKQQWLKKHNEVASGGVFLVAYMGEIFEIDSDFQVAIRHDEYNSVGCGEEYALGSLYATEDFCYNKPLERVKYALDAASYFSAGVGGDHIIEELENK